MHFHHRDLAALLSVSSVSAITTAKWVEWNDARDVDGTWISASGFRARISSPTQLFGVWLWHHWFGLGPPRRRRLHPDVLRWGSVSFSISFFRRECAGLRTPAGTRCPCAGHLGGGHLFFEKRGNEICPRKYYIDGDHMRPRVGLRGAIFNARGPIWPRSSHCQRGQICAWQNFHGDDSFARSAVDSFRLPGPGGPLPFIGILRPHVRRGPDPSLLIDDRECDSLLRPAVAYFDLLFGRGSLLVPSRAPIRPTLLKSPLKTSRRSAAWAPSLADREVIKEPPTPEWTTDLARGSKTQGGTTGPKRKKDNRRKVPREVEMRPLLCEEVFLTLPASYNTSFISLGRDRRSASCPIEWMRKELERNFLMATSLTFRDRLCGQEHTLLKSVCRAEDHFDWQTNSCSFPTWFQTAVPTRHQRF